MAAPDLLTQVARLVQDRRYGKYRAFVSSNEDPERRGRLRLKIPSVLGDAVTDWALPCFPFGGLAGHGLFAVPEPGAQVWAEFEEGDLRRPLWTGTFHQQRSDVPQAASTPSPPTTRLWQTPSGHVLQFDDESGHERLRLHHARDAELAIDENGSVAITSAAGASVKLDADAKKVVIDDGNGNSVTLDSTGIALADANGNKVELGPAGVKITSQLVSLEGGLVQLGGSGAQPALKVQPFLTHYATHIHTSVFPAGPTSPPVVPPDPSLMSLSVTNT